MEDKLQVKSLHYDEVSSRPLQVCPLRAGHTRPDAFSEWVVVVAVVVAVYCRIRSEENDDDDDNDDDKTTTHYARSYDNQEEINVPLPTASRPRNTAPLYAKAQQLRTYTQRLRAALPSESEEDEGGRVDGAWEVFVEVQDDALELARALALGKAGGGGGGSGGSGSVVEETVGRLERLSLGGSGGGGSGDGGGGEVDELGDALSGLGISDGKEVQYIDAVRAWGTVVRRLREAYDYRNGTATTMTTTTTERAEVRGSGSMGARWEARWRNYEALGRTVEEMARLTARMSEEVAGVRERFPNVDDKKEEEEEGVGEVVSTPVLRFRVSSAMLAETSPFFAHLFAAPPHGSVAWPATNDAGEGKNMRREAGDKDQIMPVYRVMGRETDAHDALTILLCAAHMQHDRVPQAVRFEQLVAIAEVCLRYECTAPVEVFVAHLWLPAWIHKAAGAVVGEGEEEEGDDGLVMVSYVFGLRRLFARLSKTAVLEVVDEEELAAKVWPARVKDSHACDAANLGWLLLVFNELQLLHAVMNPSVVPSQTALQPRRSLARLLDTLRCVPSPTSPVHHTGICDPALALRSAVNDVYNSVTGLTLFEVDGKRHGWALSRGKVREAQSVLNIPLGVLGFEGGEMEASPPPRLAGVDEDDEVMGKVQKDSDLETVEKGHPSQIHDAPRLAFQPDEATCLRILSFLDASDDLYAAARTNRTFYAAFQRNELALMRRLVRANRRLTLSVLAGVETFAAEEPKADADLGDEMTEEEACRILWPDETPAPGGNGIDGLNDGWEHVSEEDGKAQFRGSIGQKVLVTSDVMAEEKTLVVMGDKSLREQLDRRKGIASD
ncbi:hypothetical protein N0V93_009741 [Gnomoniopsis smithogilvyi]|uniref:Uncharacterized protein n=1 Tax=Gnomoniopsis smithogilvyi TaxID=1191159 RepID=A0A9W8YLE6_9PEZI|nr:hypothetical protein N0V93_009741 [Gnomoniopsis smithogilvyi]